jgi:hypothetical protein
VLTLHNGPCSPELLNMESLSNLCVACEAIFSTSFASYQPGISGEEIDTTPVFPHHKHMSEFRNAALENCFFCKRNWMRTTDELSRRFLDPANRITSDDLRMEYAAPRRVSPENHDSAGLEFRLEIQWWYNDAAFSVYYVLMTPNRELHGPGRVLCTIESSNCSQRSRAIAVS